MESRLPMWEWLSRANRVARNGLWLKHPFEVALDSAKHKRIARMQLRDGTVIENVAGNHSLLDLVYEIFVKNVYCRQVAIGDDDIVVDIGANVGVFTLYAAHRTSGEIFSVEPVPQLVTGLERNLQLNGLRNVHVHCCALGGSDGILDLGSWGGTAPIISLQRFMDENHLEKIDFLKMDCEGAEGDIFQLTPPAYLKRIRKIALEFHDGTSGLTHGELAELLQKLGFATWLRAKSTSPFGYIYAERRAVE